MGESGDSPISALQPAFPFGQTRCLDAVARPEFLDGRGEVVAHGTFGEVEPGRYISYRCSAFRRCEHLTLAFRERVVTLAQGGGRKGGVYHPLAFHGAAYGLGQFGGRS